MPLASCQCRIRDPRKSPPSPGATAGSSSSASAARGGFTLVEMLVVITIIGVLAGLVTVVAVRVLDTAKQTRIKTEVDALDLAMKAYKEKYGAYPPCDLRTGNANALTALAAHIARAFPRYNLGAGYANLKLDLNAAGVDTTYFRPDQALVFWLRGFGPDITNPFVTLNDFPLTGGIPGGTKVTRTQFFDFDQTRLAQAPSAAATAIPSYFPAGLNLNTTASTPYPLWTSGGAPYVYFDSFSNSPNSGYGLMPVSGGAPAQPNAFNAPTGTITPNTPSPGALAPPFPNAGTAIPYWLDLNGNSTTNAAIDGAETWVNPGTFQIISSGMDGKYGAIPATSPPAPRCYPTAGITYDPAPPNGNLADDDNVTNFCPRARLKDASPNP